MQVIEFKPFISPFGMRFKHCFRACTINNTGNTFGRVEANIGVQRRSNHRDLCSKHRAGMFLKGGDEWFLALLWLHGLGQQDASEVQDDWVLVSVGEVVGLQTLGDGLSNAGLYFCRVFLWDHASVELEGDPAWDDIGVGASENLTHIQIRMLDPLDLGVDLFVLGVERKQIIEHVNACL